jgi:hypothetical protein
MTGDGTSKTIMVTIMAHIAMEVHGIGPVISAHIGIHGASVHIGDGDITDITIHGITIHIVMDPDGTMEAGTIRGTMVVGTIHGIMVATSVGITRGHITYTTAGMITTIITITDPDT